MIRNVTIKIKCVGLVVVVVEINWWMVEIPERDRYNVGQLSNLSTYKHAKLVALNFVPLNI